MPSATPLFPHDVVQRLAAAAQAQGADIAMAATLEGGVLQVQPVFCLLKTELVESLTRFIHGGQRKIDKWTAQHRCVEVPFDDAHAFSNANTMDELRQLQQK